MKTINNMLIIICGVAVTFFVLPNNVQSKVEADDFSIQLETFCKTDEDCMQYISYNNCEVYCANKNEINQKILSKLEKTCDAALWFAGRMNCGCVENRCSGQGYGDNVTVKYEPCDTDRDGDCDEVDYRLFSNAIGQCEEGDNYNELADIDHDGCVTYEDEKIIFPKGAP